MSNKTTLDDLVYKTIEYLEMLIELKQLQLEEIEKHLQSVIISSITKNQLDKSMQTLKEEINDITNHLSIYREFNRW